MPKKSMKPAQKTASPKTQQTKKKSITAKAPTLKLVARIASPKKKAASGSAKAAAAKTPKKSAAKAAPKRTNSAPKTPPPQGSNVIWKFLEMKEARRKAAHEAANATHSKHHPAGHPADPQDSRTNPRHNSFAKFSGPRRRSTV